MSIRYGERLLGLLLCVMAPALAAEPEFVIQIKGHQFIPAELKIPKGEKVRIVLDKSYSLNREKHIPAKSRVTLYIGPLDAGRYVFQGEDRSEGGGAALGVIDVQ